jgi:cobalt-zinc-cadmium efflux system outer membrane protein
MHKLLLRGASVLLGGTLLAAHTLAQAPHTPTSGSVSRIDDPSLRALVRDSLAQHPQVLAAEAGLDSDRALLRAAKRPLFNPELGVSFDRSGTNDKRVDFAQTLDWADQRGARSRVAESQVGVGREQLAIARRDLSLELLTALGDHWTAAALADVATRRADLMQRLADVVTERGRVGDATQADRNLARLASAQARIERAGAVAETAAAEQRLRALVPSESGRVWPRLPVELPAVELDDARRAQHLAALPEVELRRRNVLVATSEVTLRDRQRRANPTLRFSGGEEENEPAIGLSFSMPLNVRNRYVHEVEAARADRMRAEFELDDTTRRARAALDAAAARYELVRQAWVSWAATGAPSLTQQADLLERLWRAGELNVTDYLVQLNQTLDTEVSALELERELWLAWFAWLGASGQLGDWLGVPIESVNTGAAVR